MPQQVGRGCASLAGIPPGLSASGANANRPWKGLRYRRRLPMMRRLIIAIVIAVALPNAASRAETKKPFNRALTNQYTEQLNRKVLEQLQSSEMGGADQLNRRQLESVGPGVGPPMNNFAQMQEAAPVVALNELNPDIMLNNRAPKVTVDSAAVVPQPVPAEPVSTTQTARRSGELARGSDDVPAEVLTPSSAYAPPRQRVANRTYVKLAAYAPGTVVVRTRERRLYLVLNGGQALRYPVAVGKAGQEWRGESYIESKRIRPPWTPPNDIKRANPALPDVIPGGSSSNPMGDAALLIAGGEYAIHGTNRPESIGRFVSYGCIRMYNEDVLDLYQRVQVGAMVVVER
jgi:lipoprotein-anchoring transpeptidase ErfK/SrfK